MLILSYLLKLVAEDRNGFSEVMTGTLLWSCLICKVLHVVFVLHHKHIHDNKSHIDKEKKGQHEKPLYFSQFEYYLNINVMLLYTLFE